MRIELGISCVLLWFSPDWANLAYLTSLLLVHHVTFWLGRFNKINRVWYFKILKTKSWSQISRKVYRLNPTENCFAIPFLRPHCQLNDGKNRMRVSSFCASKTFNSRMLKINQIRWKLRWIHMEYTTIFYSAFKSCLTILHWPKQLKIPETWTQSIEIRYSTHKNLPMLM